MLRPPRPPPHPYMRIACIYMTKSVSFTSCLINNTVKCHFTLLCANFTPLCAPLRYFTPLYATLCYFTVFRQTHYRSLPYISAQPVGIYTKMAAFSSQPWLKNVKYFYCSATKLNAASMRQSVYLVTLPLLIMFTFRLHIHYAKIIK